LSLPCPFRSNVRSAFAAAPWLDRATIPNAGLPTIVRGSSGSHSFDDAERTLGCHDALQLQSGLFEDSGKLLLRALSSSNDEHLNVHELAPTRVVAGRDDVIHDQDPPFLIDITNQEIPRLRSE